jgi:hypothetical protein
MFSDDSDFLPARTIDPCTTTHRGTYGLHLNGDDKVLALAGRRGP